MAEPHLTRGEDRDTGVLCLRIPAHRYHQASPSNLHLIFSFQMWLGLNSQTRYQKVPNIGSTGRKILIF